MLQIVVYASPILLFSLCCSNTIGPAIRTVPSASKQTKSAKTSYWRYAFAPRRLYVGAASVPLLRLLAQYATQRQTLVFA